MKNNLLAAGGHSAKWSFSTKCGLSVLTVLLLLAVIGCKPKNTVPSLLEPGTDAAPMWEYVPSRETFNTMTAIVQIPELLNAYQSEKDEMAVFSDAGQVLTVASLNQEANQYWLVIEQPKGSMALTVKWYCDKLTRIYTVQAFPDFVVNKMIGDTDPYVLTFIDKQ